VDKKLMSFSINNNKIYIMGILNITPDSFYDGGEYCNVEDIIPKVNNMINDGADILDIGAESSRPGSKRISAQEEIDRIVPIIEIIRSNTNIPISIDTMKSKVIKEVVKYNIQIINDISSLSDPKSLEIIKDNNLILCLMHMQNTPETMQDNPTYSNVTKNVTDYLKDKMNYCIKNGLEKENIILDPGFGFGKTIDHNYELLNNIDKFSEIHEHILVGISRKSMIGNLLQKDVENCLNGSIAASVISIINSAKIIRTHDVYETRLATSMINIIKSANK
jgi:dihydropteroate synthase